MSDVNVKREFPYFDVEDGGVEYALCVLCVNGSAEIEFTWPDGESSPEVKADAERSCELQINGLDAD